MMLTPLELDIMKAVWRKQPSTVRDVQEAIRPSRNLAYTTVMTALARLHEKGAVRREKIGRAFAYTPILDEPGIAAARMRELLEAGDDRGAVLARFVGTLSTDEEEMLAELLEEGRPEGSAPR